MKKNIKKTLVSESESIIQDVQKNFPLAMGSEIKNIIDTKLDAWNYKSRLEMIKHYPYILHKRALEKSEYECLKGKSTLASLKNDVKAYKALGKAAKQPLDLSFWTNELKKFSDINKLPKVHDPQDLDISRKLLVRHWRKNFDKLSSRWELDFLYDLRKKMLSELEEWLQQIQEILSVLKGLSIEPGLLLDLSPGSLTDTNIDQLKKWAEYLKSDKGVRRLCDMIGRMRQIRKSNRLELIEQVTYIKEFLPDINSSEEIVGIQLGRNIERVLPQEIALLADEELSILFDLKYVEGTLMSFKMEGMQSVDSEVKQKIEVEVEVEDSLGPLIICVDTSGSMQGTPETIAKAVTFMMATRAISQKRDCYLINFSTGIETMELTNNFGMSQIIQFLQKSFHGGTDVEPALKHALKLMVKETYKKADLLVISDFFMNDVSDKLIKQIEALKENKNQFYSLTIGGGFLETDVHRVFNKEWLYNPATASVEFFTEVSDIVLESQNQYS